MLWKKEEKILNSRKQQKALSNDPIQLKQKIIHYHSELITYENKLTALMQLLEKEKIRNNYLQEKLYTVEEDQLLTYQKEIHSLKEKLLESEVALEEEKKRLLTLQQKITEPLEKTLASKEFSQKATPTIQPYFAYSLMLPDQLEEQEEVVIFSDFNINNIGHIDLTEIILCIKISPASAGRLSGKISTKLELSESTASPQSMNTWAFLHDNWKEKIKENGEYWIKHLGKEPLHPNNTIQFPQFEIRLPIVKTSKSTIIEGYVYSKELPQGVFSLNKIIINY